MKEFAVKIPFIGKDKISGVLSSVRGSFHSFAKGTEKDIDHLNSKINKTLSATNVFRGVLGAQAVTAGVAELKNQLRGIADEYVSFDHSIQKAAARYGVKRGSDFFSKLSLAAREVGASTRFMASEAADGIDFFAKAAINKLDAIKLIKPTAELAVAADLNIADAADIATDSLGAFQIKAKEFPHVADVLAYTANNTNTDLIEMFETIKMAGPVMKMIGGSLEHFSAMVRPMAASGIKGSLAATALKNAMLNLSAGGGAAGDALDKLRIKTYKVIKGKKELKDLFDILDEVSVKLAKMGSADRAKYMDALFGKRAVAGMEVVLKTGVDRLREMKAEAEKSDGYTKKLAAEMGQSYETKLKTLKSAFVEVGFKVIDQFKDDIPKAIEYLTTKLQRIDGKKVEKTIKNIVKEGKDLLGTLEDLMPVLKVGAGLWLAYRANMAITGGIDTIRIIAGLATKLGVLNRNLSDVVSTAGRAPTEVGKAGQAFDSLGGKINAVVGIASTLVGTFYAAYKFGSWLNEKFIDPHNQEVNKRNEAALSAAQTSLKYGGGGLGEISSKLSRVDKGIGAATATNISTENIAGSILNLKNFKASFADNGYSNPFIEQAQAAIQLSKKRVILNEQWKVLSESELDLVQKKMSDISALNRKVQELSKQTAITGNMLNLNQNLNVTTDINFSNAPEGTTAKTSVSQSAPELDRSSIGMN